MMWMCAYVDKVCVLPYLKESDTYAPIGKWWDDAIYHANCVLLSKLRTYYVYIFVLCYYFFVHIYTLKKNSIFRLEFSTMEFIEIFKVNSLALFVSLLKSLMDCISYTHI